MLEAKERVAARLLPSILIVDDREENIELAAATLSGLEVNVLRATSGNQALELFGQHDLAMVLLDVCMPGMDGLEVARRMRARTATVPPILLITALARNDRTVESAYEIGVVDFLFKPFEPAVLRAKVQVIAEMFRLRQAELLRAREAEELYRNLVQRQSEVERLARELELQKAELDQRNRDLTLRNHQLDSFAHVVSHDLRQPLGSILDYLELIEDSADGSLGTGALQWIQSSLKVGRSMRSLIENILAYSCSGRLEEMAAVDIHTALAGALENLQASVKETGAVVTHGALEPVLGSESLLTCLFQNLIGNSIKYRSAETPKIHVAQIWCEDQGRWRFHVRDNGRGLKSEDTVHIFDMFSRCRESGEIPGAGIGLATCKRIVEAHGGRIWAQPASGGGAEFVFLLPGIAPEPSESSLIGETSVH